MLDYTLYLSKKDIEGYEDLEEFINVELCNYYTLSINGWLEFDEEGIATVNIDIIDIEGIEDLSQAINDNILIGSDYLGGIDTINSLGLSTCSR